MSKVKQYITDDERWAAVVGRDPLAQNAFVTCVLTTKIFCRPTCKVRLARRANVVFRESAAEAQAAGFRACKRCRPELAVYVEPEVQTVSQVCHTLRNLPENAQVPRLEDLAAQAGLTKFHFHRLFKKVTGKTPKEFADSCKAAKEAAKADSQEDAKNPAISTVLVPESGATTLSDTTTDIFEFWNPSLPPSFPPSLSHSVNSTPWSEPTSEDSYSIRPTISYSFEETTLGLLLVAFNEAGNVCSLELGESRNELVKSLEKKFPPPRIMTVELSDEIAKPDISNLLEAIERPSGKVWNLDESVFT